MRVAVFCAVLASSALYAGCGGGSGPVYLALGDSLAVGEGASDEGERGYVPLFYEFLKTELGDDLVLRNVGLGGETSTTLVVKGQLARALDVLRRNHDDEDGNDVVVITLDIGGNDLRALVKKGGPCAPPASPNDPSCLRAVPDVIDVFRADLAGILQVLRSAAGPDTRIFVLTLMNPYSGTGGPLDEPGDLGTSLINQQIRAAAEDPSLAIAVVDVAPAFAGRGPQLSHTGDPDPDFHPNDAGYQAMAEDLIEAYGR